MGHFRHSDDPVADAAAYYSGADADIEDKARREDYYRSQFIADARMRPLSALNSLGESVPDFSIEKAHEVVGMRPMRACTISEVLYQSLDWPNGPKVDDLITYVVHQSCKGEPTAVYLLDRMARAFASNKV